MASILAHLPSFSVASFKPSICSLPDPLLINSVAFPTGRNRRSRSLLVRSSDDDSSPSLSETATAEPELEDPPVEVPKGSPSLISALNVEKALRGIAITDVDHYGVLGISRGCPYDEVLLREFLSNDLQLKQRNTLNLQVPIAYKNKVDELKKEELEEDELNKQLEQLKESYTVLSSVEDRRLYDWSLARSDQPGRYTWPFEADITQIPTGTPPPREPEDVGPTRAVGYFLLGWLILGFTLSILLNR